MIQVEEALELFKTHAGQFGTESIPLSEAIGRVLKEDLHTDRDLPPYDRVTMDGIAIRHEDFHSGQRKFPIAGIAAAGDPQKEMTQTGTCMEVMTGSIMPLGYDTVIKYEELDIDNAVAEVTVEKVNKAQNIHFRGLDSKAGEKLTSQNQIISSAEIGIAASIGQSKIKVAKLPSTIVISTGNELVPVDATPLQHQIRKSNVYRISTALEALKVNCQQAHLDDDKALIRQKLEQYLETYDLIILSGGVSKGKFDFIPEVLEELGAEKHFHKVAQRPGKPFWFGSYKGQCHIFAFPGNPVSSFVCMHLYLIDWLGHSLGAPLRQPKKAVLTEEVSFKPDLTYFLEVKISYSDTGQILATPQKGNGSGDLVNLTRADAIIQLPRGREVFSAGGAYEVFFYR